MRFIIGFAAGIAVGAAAAVISRGQSGQDIRGEFDRIRGDIQQRDFDALGAHLEERFKELQTSLEERFAETAETVENATEAATEATEEANEATEEVKVAATA